MTKATVRLAALVAAIIVVSSGCYTLQVDQAQQANPAVKPWFCNPTAPNSVTGLGMGTVDFYAGQTRSELSWEDCRTLGAQMDLAKAFAEQYPTVADAEAAGFYRSFNFYTGMGTHHGAFGAVTPAILTDPSFNRFDPILPGKMDGTFNAGEPEFLQFNGSGPEAQLIGMSWYVRTENGQPPAGFVGGNDWWHHHPRLCLGTVDARIIQVNSSDATCTAGGGINTYMHNYYMVHLWVVDDLEYHDDVFAPTHPCIKATGAILDMNDPCHHIGAGTAPEAGVSLTADGVPTFCSLGLLAPDPASA
jgi:hypothetical protein